jgi:hypothetical protein
VAALAGLGGAPAGDSFYFSVGVLDADAGDDAAGDHEDAGYAEAQVEGRGGGVG